MRPRNAEKVILQPFPEAIAFTAWKVDTREQVTAAGKLFPQLASTWVLEVEASARASRIEEIVDALLLGNGVSILREEAGRCDRMVRGRQIRRIIYDEFALEEEHGGHYDMEDLLELKCEGSSEPQLRKRLCRWVCLWSEARNNSAL